MSGSGTKDIQDSLRGAGVPQDPLLIRYAELLLSWNQRVNLTGAKNANEFVQKHIADAYLALKTLGETHDTVYDVGTGSGIPGIVIAICSPRSRVVLVERRVKKADILKGIVESLGLAERIRILACPFEEIEIPPRNAEFWFRGFLPGDKFVLFLSKHFNPKQLGQLILMKGPGWPAEKAAIRALMRSSPAWAQRLLSGRELSYELPDGVGTRLLVIV